MRMRALGFIQEGETLKIACVTQTKTLAIEWVKTLSLSEDVKLFDMGPAPCRIATALGASEVLFRKLTLPVGEKRKALASLPFQLEALLPFSLEEAILAPIFKKLNRKATSVTLFAAKESALVEH